MFNNAYKNTIVSHIFPDIAAWAKSKNEDMRN
jgi:hypothetical protein